MGDTMATQEAYVQVKDLKKHYGDGDARMTVLDGIDASINRGEICVMLGPSGSGKSTFLNLIGGLEDADGGSIMVDGCDLTVLKPTDLGEYRRRELGFVFQFYNLVPDLTIKENIEVTAHLSKTRSMSTTCCVRWAFTSTQQVPAPGLGRPAAALCHRPRTRQKPGPAAVRRAHGRA